MNFKDCQYGLRTLLFDEWHDHIIDKDVYIRVVENLVNKPIQSRKFRTAIKQELGINK